MSNATPEIEDIERTRGDRSPDETFTAGTDLTGHTAHLVIEDSTGAVVDTIAGTVSGTSVTFAISAAAVATAGTYAYSLILDKDTPTLKRTRKAGDWIVTDYPG